MTVVDLPEHVAESDEWKRWPRKVDAHLKWGLRQRQIEQYVRTGKLKVYSCPDGVNRMDPDEMTEHFGAPDVVGTSERNISAAERQRKQADAAALSDPMAFMFRESVRCQSQLHDQLIGQLKLIPDPLRMLLDAYATKAAADAARIRELETQVDAANKARSDLLDMSLVRDLEVKRHQSSERRRDETLQLLKDQLPELVKKWLDGDSLSAFAKRAPKDVIQAVVESDTIAEHDAEILRRSAGIAAKAPPNPTANGVSDHGHS